MPTANGTFAIGEVSPPLDSFVLTKSSVVRIKFSAEKPAHRKPPNVCDLNNIP